MKEILNQNKFTVLFSGGKDSLATLLWIIDNVNHKNWNILYIEMTNNTHPLCTKYVYEIVEHFNLLNNFIHVKTQDFFELMNKWGPPLPFYRWCLTLKSNLIKKYAYFITVSGIKKSDSKVRKKLQILSICKKSKKLDIKPILEWSNKDVYAFIKEHGISMNPCYKLYGNSGNCMFCPYADKNHIINVMSDKEWGEKIRKVLLKNKMKMMKGRIGKEIYERWMNGQLSLISYL
ncbi:MAG: phosphoadenosine phosphosulfate reductase family protein [candidate division WOR-3 bacterium]